MKESVKRILVIQILMLLMLLTGLITKTYVNTFIQILFIVIILAIMVSLFGIDLKKPLKQKEILTNVLIVILSYFMLTYLSGLFIGFVRTGYSHKILKIIYNTLPAAIIIVLSEILRYEFINKSNKNIFVTILSCIIFILFENYINVTLYNFDVTDEIFEFIGLIFVTSISKNIFLTIMCYNSGFVNNVIYRLIMELYVYIVPFYPDFGPYIRSILSISLPILLSFIVIVGLKRKINDKPIRKKKNKFFNFLIIFLLLVVVLINSGYFKYRTYTIGSNSMLPYIKRGDVVIVEKYKKEAIKNIKLDDVLLFNYDGKIICHRVVKVTNKKNNIYFKTKGDNNDQPDDGIVDESKVIGIVKVKIKYIGLPSVWLQEILK